MPITLSVSTLAQSNSQSKRLLRLGNEMDNLQRQITSGKKYDTYTGFGTQSYTLQNLKNQEPELESYIDNIDKVSSDMEQMISLLSRITEISNEVKGAINLRENTETGIKSLSEFAQSNLDFIQEIINEKGVDGNHLFSGGNILDPAFVNGPELNSNYNNEVMDWLNGTNTPAQLTANSDAFTSSNLGFSTALNTAEGRNVQIDDKLTVDYSVKGNIDGLQNIVRALTLVANMEYPGPGDVATAKEMDEILSYAVTTISQGIVSTNDQTELLTSKFSFIKSIGETHKTDLETYREQVDEIENSDPSEALLKMQLLQTQLETSYQITSLVSKLSLVDFIR